MEMETWTAQIAADELVAAVWLAVICLCIFVISSSVLGRPKNWVFKVS